MKKFILIFTLLCSIAFAQNKANEVLFTIDNEDVLVDEFKRVYTKNNINNEADFSKESLQEYLDLFINFKLKVREAEMLKMDTIPSIQQELSAYQKQLVKSYANDKEVTNELINEAFERSKQEVDASHILILWPNEYPSSTDSLKVLNEIKKIKKKANSSNFNELAVQYSQDPSAKSNKGHLSYLTVFQTVYPFENALYNTAVGQISEPVATQFGYHLVLVHDKRPARGKITTAHILIKSKEEDTPEQKENAKQKAQQIYNELLLGKVDFKTAAKQYSEDNKTKYNGGKLPELTSAEMLAEYADAAFALENNQDFSKPVKTNIGWHIIQLIDKKEVPAFEEAKSTIAAKVARDSRSNVAITKNVLDSKQKFGYSFNAANLDEVETILKSKKNYAPEKLGKEIFKIGNKSYTQSDFIGYVNKKLKPNDPYNSTKIKGLFRSFENEKIQAYREDHLAEINDDYKNLMQEYHDGILLFELTNQEVWDKAVKDSSGLKAFHNKHENDYMWNERADVYTYTFNNEKTKEKALKLLNKGKSPESIAKKLNKKEVLFTFNNQKLEKKDFAFDKLSFAKSSSSEKVLENGKIEYTVVNDILAPQAKAFNETKGYVISDYQTYLEKQWIDRLKQKYNVQLNQDVFNSLIK